MSELATEVANSSELLGTVEFLGQNFEDRRRALGQAAAFYEMTKQALADNVEAIIGQDVHMVFRPGSTTLAEYKGTWFPCYSWDDSEREPYKRDVRLISMDEHKTTIILGANPQENGSFDQKWTVKLTNILSVAEPKFAERLF